MTTNDIPTVATGPKQRLRPSPEMARLQEQAPVHRVRTPAGDEAWLVTRHAELKQLLMDKRVGRSHKDPASAPRYMDNPFMDMLIIEGDGETGMREHTDMRSTLSPMFSLRRINALRPMVDASANELVDAMEAAGPPADLHRDFSMPFALNVLYGLIGVAPDKRGRMFELLGAMAVLTDPQSARDAGLAMSAFLNDLVAGKRSDPGDDVISRLIDAGLSDQVIATRCAGLLFAGLDSVVSHIDVGVVLLAEYPEQRAAAQADPTVLKHAVEEVLRTASAGDSSLPRYANADIEIGGVTIREGDLVLLDFTLTNFDPREFDRPEEFDVERHPNPHMTFGHGIWHCVGAPLARVELQSAFVTLFGRLPGLRPTTPLLDLDADSVSLSGGFNHLPVTW